MTVHQSNKPEKMSLSKSYVIVPRNVPPDNFMRVPGMKKQKSSVRDTLRNILFIFLFICLAAGGVSGVYLFFSDSVYSDNDPKSPEAVKQRDRGNEHRSDHHENSYRAFVTRDNVTVYIRDLMPVSSVDPCLSGPCHEGGSCEGHDGTFTCHCPPGTGGRTCHLRTGDGARLRAHSRIVLNTDLGARRVISIKLRIRPASMDGIVLKSGNLILRLVSGKLQLKFGDQSFSYEDIVVGEWSQVTIAVYHGDVRLQTGHHPPMIVTPGPDIARVLGASLCLGDCDQGTGRGLAGCLADLRLGHAHTSLLGPGAGDSRAVDTCRG